MPLPTITTFAWVPGFARGFVRDIRARRAFEEVGQPHEVALIRDGLRAFADARSDDMSGERP